jgi:hypothetical protein
VALSIALFPCIKILIASSPAQFSDASVDLPQTTESTLKVMFSQKNQIESNSTILRYINADSAGTVQFIFGQDARSKFSLTYGVNR